MATYTAIYTGTFGGNSAGTNGRSTTLTGDAIPSGFKIAGISYTIQMSAGGYSSSHYWEVHQITIGNNIYAGNKKVRMTGTRGSISGSMYFSGNQTEVFDGSISLHAKVNTTHSSTSYMYDISVTVTYKDEDGSSSSSSSSSPSDGSITLDKTSVNAGEEIKITLPEDTSGASYSVTWSLGEKSTAVSVGGAVAHVGQTFTIPMDWCEEIPDSTSGMATVKAEKKSGNAILLTQTKTFLVSVPSDIKPNRGEVSVSIVKNAEAGFPDRWETYVEGKTGITITAEGFSGAYGSTIRSYTYECRKDARTLLFGTKTGDQSNTITWETIPDSGNLKLIIYATDSRGRKSEKTELEQPVEEYHLPLLSTLNAYRCNEQGEADDDGRYIRASASVSFAKISPDGTTELKCKYREHGEGAWSEPQSMTADDSFSVILGEGNIDTAKTYQVMFSAKDMFSTVERMVNVSTTVCTFFVRKGGTSIGLGKMCDYDNAVEFNPNWSLYYGRYTLLPIVFSETRPDDPYDGLIWLEPKR